MNELQGKVTTNARPKVVLLWSHLEIEDGHLPSSLLQLTDIVSMVEPRTNMPRRYPHTFFQVDSSDLSHSQTRHKARLRIF